MWPADQAQQLSHTAVDNHLKQRIIMCKGPLLRCTCGLDAALRTDCNPLSKVKVAAMLLFPEDGREEKKAELIVVLLLVLVPAGTGRQRVMEETDILGYE